MSFKNVEQPNIININEKLRLVKANSTQASIARNWYQDPKILYYSEGKGVGPYHEDSIDGMYRIMEMRGELFFIELKEDNCWIPIGDVGLLNNGIPIVLGVEKYWGRGIATAVMSVLIERAKDIGLKKLYAKIYKYNERSLRLFTKFGFKKCSEDHDMEHFEYEFKPNALREVVISYANSDDEPAISNLSKIILNVWGIPSQSWNKKENLEKILNMIKRRNLFVAKYDESLIGYLAFLDRAFDSRLEKDRVHIRNCCIHPAFRRMGVAEKLRLHFISECKKRNIGRITTNHSKSNLPIIKLSTKLGFKEYQEEIFNERCESDVFMELKAF